MTYCLISWGANSHGQLGQEIRSEECILPREVDLSKCSLDPQRINKIVGGAGHTLILDDSGRVYSCGWNNKGQLGFSTVDDVLSFRRLDGKLKKEIVVDVACGWDFSAALTVGGTLFLWGSNNFGQLGESPKYLQLTNEPLKVITDRKIKSISLGLRHTVLVTKDHKVFVAGANNKGQLGSSNTIKEQLTFSVGEKTLSVSCNFTEVPTLSDIEDVCCGQHHTIAIAKDGSLYTFGDNKHGQLGLSIDVFAKTSVPKKLSDLWFKLPVKAHSGWSHVIVLNESQMFAWGRNTYGQLGIAESPSTWKATRIENASKIRQVSIGSEHNVVLTEDGKIICWGWNEHGNCGNGNKKDVKQPEELRLPYDYTGILVGSGAGHSFAVIKRS